MDNPVYTFVLVVHILLACALVGVVLLQRSEGGALGIGSGPSGFMTARGASNLLTRATGWLTALFVITSITLAGLAAGGSKASADTEKRIQEAASKPAVPAEPQVPAAK